MSAERAAAERRLAAEGICLEGHLDAGTLAAAHAHQPGWAAAETAVRPGT